MPARTRREFLNYFSLSIFGLVDLELTFLEEASGSLGEEDETKRECSSKEEADKGIRMKEVWKSPQEAYWNSARHDLVVMELEGVDADWESLEVPEDALLELDDNFAQFLYDTRQRNIGESGSKREILERMMGKNLDEGEEPYARYELALDHFDGDEDELADGLQETVQRARSIYFDTDIFQSEPTERDLRSENTDFGEWRFPDSKQEWKIEGLDESTLGDLGLDKGYNPYESFDVWRFNEKIYLQFHEREKSVKDVMERTYMEVEQFGTKSREDLNRDQRLIYEISLIKQ
jgi:hypothetical protein